MKLIPSELVHVLLKKQERNIWILIKFFFVLTVIQFFYLPWLDAQNKAQAPRELPEGMKGHGIVTNYDLVSIKLVESSCNMITVMLF